MPDTNDNEELKALKKKRGSIKAKLTIFEKFVKSVECLQTSSEQLDRLKLIEIEQRIQDIQPLISHFDDIQSEIEYVLDDYESEFAEREEFNNKFYSVMSLAKNLVETNNISSDNKNELDSNCSSNKSSSCGISDGVKLPEIKLPKFDGAFQNWLDFRDIFASLIHENPKINNIQKFHYLRASLIDTAPQVIQSIEFCSTNYDIAWKTLCERFNNTNLLIQNHINAIFKAESINTESATKIRNLSDSLFKHLTSLKQLGEPTEYWDTLVIYIISNKLDRNTAREWERIKAKQRTSCTLDYFKNFLKERADLLENLEINLSKNQTETRSVNRDSRNINRDNKRATNTRGFHTNTNENNINKHNQKSQYKCYFCKKDHSLFYCSDFLRLSVDDRLLKVKEFKLCVNCLRPNHTPNDCRWSGCKICSSKHNTILHGIKENTNIALSHINDSSNISNKEKATCTFATAQNTILCTAQVDCRDITGNLISARALLDCGSQSSFITSELCEKLNLQTTKIDLTITGISDKTTRSTQKCHLKVRSKINSFSFDLSCFVLDKITSDLPGMNINRELLNIPTDIKLADPQFESNQKIDLLIGADVFWNLLSSGKIELGKKGPFLQNTRIGWIVAGSLSISCSVTVCNFSKISSLQNELTKFWTVEEISNNKPLSHEDTLCEKHFVDNLTYSPEGRFVVSLPLKDSPCKLGDSRDLAIRRFDSLERRLHSNETLRHLYTDFLNEYHRLGHMTELTDDQSENNDPEYYLPHHGVLKETSSTTKLRVVFNASAPSASGLSLNDLQMTGPIIQSDLLSILLRFRMRHVVLSGDIKMMYRQVLINSNQRSLQKIVWRSDPNESLKTYQLNTVTYGTTAGSFLAIRSLHEVANECENEFPNISNIIKNDMYVDDLLTCVDSNEEAKYIAAKIYEILRRRGFELRKWKSNQPDVINALNIDQSSDTLEFSANKEQDTRILGLLWASSQDILTFKISPIMEIDPEKITKRVVLSRIATIFDPLGLVSPSIIIAKVILQKLWAENLTWDQPLPKHVLNQWLEFSTEIDILNSLQISRQVTCEQPNYVALHGFSDACESSYGACVYILSKNKFGDVKCALLCAKSKVAPIKSLTMPRLELCAALILSQLISKTIDSINTKLNHVFCWSDSTIVLGWLRTSPNLLKPFVDHRVADIQRLTDSFTWRHVPTKDNPADLVSRGLRPRKLIHSELWWHGPQWLLESENEWPDNHMRVNDLPEMRSSSFVCNKIIKTYFPFERFSNLLNLKRVAAYAFRFINNARSQSNQKQFSNLTFTELNKAFEKLLKLAQSETFSEEISILSSKRELPSTCKIISLHPFLDDQGLLRVGGRLSNSDFSYSKKYPILLSSQHTLTKLIMQFEHESLLHAGPQLLLSHVRDKFWPISGRNLARKVVRNCVKCCRYDSRSVQPLMGDLPAVRLQQALPFINVGVDYSGPFSIKDRRGRGCKIVKCWIAVFICLSTRAIHLELVLSLSSEDFLQAFNRFISRRGKPAEMFSDNGTNFVKANKDLHSMGQFLQENRSVISESAANIGIKWHFIPANSPHFGGIWEAGVKSLKHHLKRVVGSYTLFLFDFQTLVVRIEAVLNSRPISPLSSDPNDLSPLTPAHFLIGRSATTVPEPSVVEIPENRLSQFQLVQKVHEQFWNRWQHEYISELQQRQKWKRPSGCLNVGQLVLVKDNNLPPMKWRLGRVLNLITGKDGISRVASVKTMDGVITRAVVRLCPLPC